MKYKIIHNNKVIDVVDTPRFVRFLSTGHVTFTDKGSANGIEGSNHVTYSFEPVKSSGPLIVTIEPVANDEFSRLKSLLDSGKEVCADPALLAATKNTAIAKLSDTCKRFITDGFKVKLSDRRTYHFRLTAEDQLNLLNIENQLNTGAESFVYHSTDSACKVYSIVDMKKIITTFRKHVLYHTTYFNTAKQYINALNDLEKVTTFKYGMDVSSATSDKSIKQILGSGGFF